MAGIEAASRPDISLVLTMSLLFAGIALLYKTVYHLQETPAPLFNLAPVAIPTFRLILRITSYNVCYTKLLRCRPCCPSPARP